MKNERNEVLEQLFEEHYDSVFRLCASIVRNDSKLYPFAAEHAGRNHVGHGGGADEVGRD